MKILLLSILIAMTLVVIPNADAESYEDFLFWANRNTNTYEDKFQAFSSWASDNKDILGKDVSFYVENISPMKGDFTVSNIAIIPDERVNHVLSFDTTVKLKSELRYPHEFVMDGRSLTVMGETAKNMDTFLIILHVNLQELNLIQNPEILEHFTVVLVCRLHISMN